MTTSFTPQQVYKSRAAAFRLFFAAQGLPVSQSKFYQDAERLNLVRTDKTLHLSDLIGYVKTELKINPMTGQSLGEIDRDERKSDADARKAVADADKAEMQAEAMRRELDARWILRESADEETCVWVSRLRDATAYHIGKALRGLIHACGGDVNRLAEVQSIADAALADAANEISRSDEITVTIADDEDPC